MKQYILILIGILCLQSCVVTKSIKYGNASVDDYSVFEQDTIARGLRTFRFANVQQNSTLIDTLKFDIYLSKADTLLNLTLRETMDYIMYHLLQLSFRTTLSFLSIIVAVGTEIANPASFRLQKPLQAYSVA